MKKRKPSRQRSPTRKRSAHRKRSQPAVNAGPRPGREWIGGRFLAPVFVGPDEPYRPVLELWVTNDFILHCELHDPNEPIPALSKDLRQKLLDPPIGRRPRRLRLNDPDWAAQVRRVLPMFDVVAGPTPELEGPLDDLASAMEDEKPSSYLNNRLSADAMAALFTAASALYASSPGGSSTTTSSSR